MQFPIENQSNLENKEPAINHRCPVFLIHFERKGLPCMHVCVVVKPYSPHLLPLYACLHVLAEADDGRDPTFPVLLLCCCLVLL